MKTVLMILGAWFILSAVLGVVVGKFIAAGSRLPREAGDGRHLRIVR